MTTISNWEITTASPPASLVLATRLGERLKGGEVIELVGDLGSGKTAFVRGLAVGFGSSDSVSSPSFTLSNQYAAGELTMHHFDFYRLSEPGILRAELDEIMADKRNCTVIEWADIVSEALPSERLTIVISVTGEFSRLYRFSCPAPLVYLASNEIGYTET